MYLLVILSIINLVFSPISLLSQRIIDVAPTLAYFLAVTEGMFILGIFVMGSIVGYDLGWNPLNWRKHLYGLAAEVNKSKVFWIGFWINSVGAIGTGLVLAYGVVRALPVSSWGLLWLAVADISVTIGLRATLLGIHREKTE